MRDEVLELIKRKKPGILERKAVVDRIIGKIVGIVKKFINGIVG